MPLTSLHHHITLACVVALVLVTALSISAPGAAGAAEAENALGTTAESPIAVPIVGSYEVWCTDRNPAPGSRCSRHHGSPAIDVGMEIGTPVHATGDGVVIETETGCGFGYCRGGAGNFISIGHADGSFSRYLHLDAVLVVAGDDVAVGQHIGNSGASGQSSSPHLHYDEHFPAGTRTPMGPWIGCVAGEQVRYPDTFGVTDWNDVPYGSIITNDGFGCLDGVSVSNVPRAVIIPGSTRFGVVAPTTSPHTQFEISLSVQDRSSPEVQTLRGTAVALFPQPDAPVAVRIRQLSDGSWGEWSNPIVYEPAAIEDQPVCGGLYATTSTGQGTPTVDVIIGTDEPDTIDARGGDDFVCGNGGDDSILAGPGRDMVWGGDGDDTISGGRGADLLVAGPGNDAVRGGDGPDKILGGPGDDSLLGTAGNDRVEGGSGIDLVIGGIGHDWLLGGSSDDVIEGRNGRDYLGGGNGEDELSGGNGRDRLVGAAGIDSFDGGSGSDRCAPDSTGSEELFEGCER